MNIFTVAHGRRRRIPILSSTLLGLLALTVPCQAQPPADVVWIEAESPSHIAPESVKPEISNFGHPEYLSGKNWLRIQIGDDKVEAQAPADGVILSYKFVAPRQAQYEVWDRVGYEAVRSQFDWRVDGGEWTSISPTAKSTDLVELGEWSPLAWIKLGTSALNAGDHTVEIRLPKTKDSKGKLQQMFYASDAICLSASPFHPNDGHRPGDSSWKTDRDRAAATATFQIIPPRGAAQSSTTLKGDWQIARWDEDTVKEGHGPIAESPPVDTLSWRAIAVPGDRNKALPEWTYNHRYFLRMRVNVPNELNDHSFYLHFPSLSMIATVFVNGQTCGSTKSPYAAWDCDITKALKPGQTNEVWVGVKDYFYAMPIANDGGLQYITTSFIGKFGPVNLDFPVWGHYETGILKLPTLVTAGKVYTSDVFALPSVKNKSLGLEVTVANPTAQDITVQIANEIVPLAGGAAEKAFASKSLTIPAGGSAVLKTTETWANPKLWWPDDPTQYQAVTRIFIDGKVVDERRTKFGFREWGWNGPTFTLNGIPWHGRADLFGYNEISEASLATWRKHGQNMQRVWSVDKWGEADVEDALDFYDAHGVPVRRTGVFDGEGAGYYLTDDKGPKKELFDNWRNQLVAWARGQRNHPSIFIWSIDNEITFINAHVFGQDQTIDPEMRKAGEMVMAMDPTRPVMTDGGNALLDESLPVYGGHYMEPAFNSLPEGAYDRAGLTHRQVWPITHARPMLFGESFYAGGTELSDFATVGGEAAFVGKSESHPALGLVAKMLSEGYRWNGISFHFWFGGESDLHYNSWQPIAALCRQWDWTFGSGQTVKRTLGIFNDTRFDQPVNLTWTLNVGGKKVASQTTLHQVKAGMDDRFDVSVPMPHVSGRQEGQWTLALTANGKAVFQDAKPISILPQEVKLGAPIMAKQLAVFDPSGGVSGYLTTVGTAFTRVTDLKRLPYNAKVLIVGKDALDSATSTSSILSAYASAGRVVIVLEQKNPLRFQGLPGEMTSTPNQGYVAFAEDLNHPILHGLQQKDFFTWAGGDGLVYRNAYEKPTTGGKSLIQCDAGLKDTVLAQMPTGKGLLLISQLMVGSDLTTSAVARRLLTNMIGYGAQYHVVIAPVTVAASDNPQLMKALDATGLHYSKANDPLEAIARSGSIAIVNATPANLKMLASNKAKLDAFANGGGWILFNNLTPEGLADYNRIVGFDHMIRPFTQEKVTFPVTRNPLTAGLPTSNIVMGGGKQIFPWSAGQFPDTDAFSYVVDYDEVAPFGKSDFFSWSNIVNNFTMADGFWPLIINYPAPKDGKPYDIHITLPKAQTISQWTWVSDMNYSPTTKVNLIFDGKDKVEFATLPNGDPQTFPVNPPRTARNITLQIAGWQVLPGKGEMLGIDNIYFKTTRPADFYKKVRPLLNIGAMLEYSRGSGGFVLCNVKFKDSEAVPENAAKKQTIIATILRNLNAPFSGGKTIIAGAANLTYTPIDLSKQANAYRNDRGWFGDKSFTFADLPTGKHNFAGVPYNVYEFTTSPVPTIVMLGGNGVPGNLPGTVTGIPVGHKADALFFLQAARMDTRRNNDEIKQNRKYEMADYVVHYADGQTMNVPVYAEINVDDYRQKSPSPLSGAQIAWAKPYPGNDTSSVAYSMQWTNPRPNVAIESVDLVYGPDRRGVPALLALTAAIGQ